MSFTELQLPDFILADLYKDVLVELKSGKQIKKKEIATPPQQWFLGDNRKQVTIVVRDEEAVYLRDEWLSFLSSILGACQFNLADVAIVNYTKTNCTFPELLEKTAPQFLLLFDVTAQEMHLPFIVPHYQVLQHNNCSFLLAPSLQSMLDNTQGEKRNLWTSLKKMFNI
jgi:hypothetical protein